MKKILLTILIITFLFGINFAKAADELSPQEILSNSFSNFRNAKNFYYSETRSKNNISLRSELGLKEEEEIRGVFFFPDKAHLINFSKSFSIKNPESIEHKYIEETVDNGEVGDIFFVGDKLFIKNYQEYLNLSEELHKLVYKKFNQFPLSDLSKQNSTTEVLTAYKIINSNFNLNNPEIINKYEYLGTESLEEKEYYKFKIIDYDLEKLMLAWNDTDTKMTDSNIIEGYDIKDFATSGKNPEIYNDGELWIDAATLLPYKIIFNLVLQCNNLLDGKLVKKTVTRNITFSRFNDTSLYFNEPTGDMIIDEAYVSQLYNKLMTQHFNERAKEKLSLANRLKGKIVLQVEDAGQAYYVNPDNLKKYYLGRPADAFNVMRELGLGISNSDFDSFNGYAPQRLSGKILLKVEDNGKAYYVNPDDLKMYYLGRPADAFHIMKELGLGITNNDLNKIENNE